MGDKQFGWFDGLSIFLNQPNATPGNKLSRQLLWISLILLSFWTIQYYTGYFGTDIVLEKPAKYLETLEDVANGDKRPMIVVNVGMEEFFSRSPFESHRKIWSKTLLDKRMSHFKHTDATSFYRITQQLMDRSSVFMGNRVINSFLKAFMCLENRSREAHADFRESDVYYEGKAFALYSARVTPELRERLDRASYAFVESGIYGRHNREAGMSLPFVAGDNSMHLCLLQFLETESEKDNQSNEQLSDVSLQSVFVMFKILFESLFTAFSLLLIEIIVARLSTFGRKGKKRRSRKKE